MLQYVAGVTIIVRLGGITVTLPEYMKKIRRDMEMGQHELQGS